MRKRQTKVCNVCEYTDIVELINLPDLPLTDTYCIEQMEDLYGGIDQALLYCPRCGHAQLSIILDTNILYGDKYHFRTSESATGRSGSDFFISYLKSLFPEKKYSSVLDLGCNDLYLLNKLQPITKACFGIDPMWSGREAEVNNGSIKVFGKYIEELNRSELSAISPDLVVCRHTLEHIENPKDVLQYLFDAAKDNCIFLFEFPGFEALINKQRFDYIFHQHLQYFSLKSFLHLIHEVGGEYISHTWNYHNWGALLVAFNKKRTNPLNTEVEEFTAESICKRYDLFQRRMQMVGELLEGFNSELLYGYGAAQMLPVISYHLKNDLSSLRTILDDDPKKDGLSYWNLPVKISHSSKAGNMEESTVLITAIDNFKPIYRKLLDYNPKHIVYPLHII